MKTIAAVTVAIAILFVPLAMAKPKNSGARATCITAEADEIFEALKPLTKSCSRVGPASARWYMNASVWNDFSDDQQQQLMDQVASREAIQAAHVTIHIYVSSTDVGQIGPGWTGEWKFRPKN